MLSEGKWANTICCWCVSPNIDFVDYSGMIFVYATCIWLKLPVATKIWCIKVKRNLLHRLLYILPAYSIDNIFTLWLMLTIFCLHSKTLNDFNDNMQCFNIKCFFYNIFVQSDSICTEHYQTDKLLATIFTLAYYPTIPPAVSIHKGTLYIRGDTSLPWSHITLLSQVLSYLKHTMPTLCRRNDTRTKYKKCHTTALVITVSSANVDLTIKKMLRVIQCVLIKQRGQTVLFLGGFLSIAVCILE